MFTKILAWIKSKWLLTLLSTFAGYVISFLVPLLPFLLIVLSLVICDLFTGIRAANKRGEEIRSKGLRRTVFKFIEYAVAILLAEGMSKVFFPGLPLTFAVACFIALTEFKSNLENISVSTGTNVLSVVLERLNIDKIFNWTIRKKTDNYKQENEKSEDDPTAGSQSDHEEENTEEKVPPKTDKDKTEDSV